MKKVHILFTKYSDGFSWIYRILGHTIYSHTSISLDDKENFYSFNYKGFCKESYAKHKRHGVKKSVLYEMEVSDDAYETILNKIMKVNADKKDFYYTKFGVICSFLHIPFHWNKHYFCSQFVAELLKDSKAVDLRRRAEGYLPENLRCEIEKCPQTIKFELNPI